MVGKSFVVKGLKYKVTSSKSVSFINPKSKKVNSITIPNQVKIKGVVYKVTSIANNAGKSLKKLKKLTIGTNVKSIGKSAFSKCKKLTKIIVKTKKLTKIGKLAFKGIHKKAKFKVSNKKVKKLIKKKVNYRL